MCLNNDAFEEGIYEVITCPRSKLAELFFLHILGNKQIPPPPFFFLQTLVLMMGKVEIAM